MKFTVSLKKNFFFGFSNIFKFCLINILKLSLAIDTIVADRMRYFTK